MNDQNDYRSRLGLNIRRRRHGMRLTQEELAVKLGCSSKTISAIGVVSRICRSACFLASAACWNVL